MVVSHFFCFWNLSISLFAISHHARFPSYLITVDIQPIPSRAQLLIHCLWEMFQVRIFHLLQVLLLVLQPTWLVLRGLDQNYHDIGWGTLEFVLDFTRYKKVVFNLTIHWLCATLIQCQPQNQIGIPCQTMQASDDLSELEIWILTVSECLWDTPPVLWRFRNSSLLILGCGSRCLNC